MSIPHSVAFCIAVISLIANRVGTPEFCAVPVQRGATIMTRYVAEKLYNGVNEMTTCNTGGMRRIQRGRVGMLRDLYRKVRGRWPMGTRFRAFTCRTSRSARRRYRRRGPRRATACRSCAGGPSGRQPRRHASARKEKMDALLARLAEAVVQVVVLDGEAHADSLERPQDWVAPVRADARVTHHLDVLRASESESA